MAPQTWSNLPPDILSTLSKILNTDVDILRLRSVCSSWRSSVPPRPRPSPFPLNVPPLLYCSSRIHRNDCRYILSCSTLYRLSPPEHGPCAGDDPSDGWLIRVSEVNPNRFSLLCPMVPNRVDFSPGTIPKHLNLLDYRITEISKCYKLEFVDPEGFPTHALEPCLGKIIVLWNYTEDCDFVVLVLFTDFAASYWKFGQKDWTLVDTKGYGITDAAVCNGKCYVINDKGVLFFFDSNMDLKMVDMPRLPMDHHVNATIYLVEYKSDLYVERRIYENINRSRDEDAENEVPFRCEVFKKCKNNWKPISCLGDAVFFNCMDVAVGFSAEDFRCCKGNSVYVAIDRFIPKRSEPGRLYKYIYSGVHGLADGKASYMKLTKDCTFMYWPPPRWLTSR